MNDPETTLDEDLTECVDDCSASALQIIESRFPVDWSEEEKDMFRSMFIELHILECKDCKTIVREIYEFPSEEQLQAMGCKTVGKKRSDSNGRRCWQFWKRVSVR